ncbi:MAG: thioredoxin [Phycisphaerales bacterium]|nr:thioredoxin [Phycisphaerales bacterium]
MSSANVVNLTDANFDAEVINSAQPMLVDFYASWCGPCKILSPVVDALADQFAGKARVGKVDTDNARAVSVKHGITALPTLLVFKNGQVVKRWVGLTRKEDIAAVLTEVSSK